MWVATGPHLHLALPGTCLHSVLPGTAEQPHLFTEKKSRRQGAVFWGPEVTLPGKQDRNPASNEINTHAVPHFLFVQAWIRLTEISRMHTRPVLQITAVDQLVLVRLIGSRHP